MEIYVTNVKEIFVCKKITTKKKAFYIKINA